MGKYVFILILFLACGCHDVTVGYLDTRNAVYAPDSLVVKTSLDPDDFNDAYQLKFKIPYQSASLTGIDGTAPIKYSIKSIEGDHPEAESQFTMKGAGVIELPYNHTVPAGRYKISILVENEGYRVVLDNLLTVIVR